MQINPERIRSILCVRNDRFGEFLLNIPALRALKETFINASIIMVVEPKIKDLMECIPFVDEVICRGRDWHSLPDKLKFILLLKRRKIDIAVMLNPSKEFNIFTYLAAIPIRAGYARKWDFLLTHRMEDKKHLGLKHEVEYNLELVGLIGAATADKTLSLKINNDIINNLLAQYGIKENDILLALHPWTSDPVKRWPLENFRELAKMLLGERNIKVAVIGGKEETLEAEGFCRSVSSQGLINLTGRTSLSQLAAFLRRCRLLVSADSGPVHLASAAGTRVLAIFRNNLPGKTSRRWGPRGSGHIVIEKNNLFDISAAEVFEKAKEALRT